MPLIRIETNQDVAQQAGETILDQMTELVVKELNKPREYVQVAITPNCRMAFAGTREPAAFVELRSLGLPDEKPKALSAEICRILSDTLSVPPSRVFINFFDMPRAHWGWNGNTFG